MGVRSGEYLTALSSRFHTALDNASSSASIGMDPLRSKSTRYPEGLRLHAEVVDDALHELGAVAGLEMIRPGAGLHPAEVEHRFDQPRESIGGPGLDVVTQPPAVRVQVRLFQQPVGELPQGGQRSAELVRNRRHEIRLQARDRHLSCHRAEDEPAGCESQHRDERETRKHEAPAFDEAGALRRCVTGRNQLPGQL